MANFNPNDYETVDSRIKRFYADHPNGRIITSLVSADGEIGATRWVVRAEVFRDNGYELPDGSDYAFEVDGGRGANATAALENCATSAIGRALANIGYSGDKRASREEMGKTQQPAPAPVPPAEWRAAVAAVKTIDELQTLYDTEARNWYTPEVKAAFTAKRKEIEGANA